MPLRINKLFAIILLVTFISGCASMKSHKNDRQEKKVFTSENFRLNYLLYLPKNYSDKDEYPLVLFLHGSGERGRNIEKVKRNGLPKKVEEGEEFPFILVSPQCPNDERWNPQELSALLDEIEKEFRVDKNRIYLTGLSMGGYGVWKLASLQPERFAALIPVCGGGDFLNACMMKDIPVWVFHGARDKVVSVQESQRMVEALKRCGGNPLFTIYPEAGHDSWTETYNNRETYEWLLKQSKNNKPG